MHFHRHRNDDIRPSCVEAVHLRREGRFERFNRLADCPHRSGKWRPLPERRQLDVVAVRKTGTSVTAIIAVGSSSRPRSWAGWAIPPGSDPSQRSPCCRGRRRFPLPPVAFGRKTTLQGRQAPQHHGRDG